MTSFFTRILLCFSLLAGLTACHDENVKDDDHDLSASQRLNKFIARTMKDIYYWADEVRNREISLDSKPGTFLNQMKSEEDHWSALLENGIPVRSLSDGQERGIGYQLKFYSHRNSIFAQIIYVYPGSPAEQAGLKRGDLIATYNGAPMQESNYAEVATSTDLNIRLGNLTSGGIAATGREYHLQAATYEINPIVLDTIFEIEGRRIGYLFYLQFIDNQRNSLEQLNTVAAKFKQQGIDDFILDLRYNNGGAVTAARRLSSLLAPLYPVSREDLLITKEWNATYQAKYENREDLTEEHFESAVIAENLDLRHIYFLVSSLTASASELVISGLEPYLPQTLIGDLTAGKYVGSILRKPEDNDLKTWELYPIVFAYKNARGVSVKGGLSPAPENEISEYTNFLYPIGDTNDPLIARALNLITGHPAISPASKALPYSIDCRPLPDVLQAQKAICLQY